MRLKLYTTEGKKINSIPFTDAQTFIKLLDEALLYFNPRIIFVSTGKGSKVIYQKPADKRSSYYKTSNGVTYYGLSIHAHNYPMTEYLEDGTTIVHSLPNKERKSNV